MKSKEEIEKYLGMKIESNKEEQTRDSGYAMSVDMRHYVSKEQQSYTVTVKVLAEESKKALKSLLKDSIKKGDLETAATCHSILLEESTFYKEHPNAIGLDINEGMALKKYEEEQKAIVEEQARLKAEQDAKEKAEEQARLKAEQEAKEKAEEQTRLKAEQEAEEKAEEQARLKAEQEAKERAEEQARLKAEQEEKERQASIKKDIAEYEQYEELISRKPELDKLLEDLKYEEFSSTINKYTSERMVELLNDLKKLPQEERKIILQQYNKLADLKINEQGDIIRDVKGQDDLKSERQDTEQESEKIKQVVEETIEDEPSVAGETIEDTTATVTGTNIDIDSASMIEAHLEYMRNHQIQQTSQVVEDYWNEIHSQQAKIYEQPQSEEIRPRDKSIKDEVGDELRTTEQHTQKQDNPSVDLWMNRFNGWYSAIDRVSQSVKEKFVKMKSDIIKAISEKLKERTNNRQFNTQEQDTNER